MNRTELVAAVATESGVSKEQADAVLSALATTLESALARGEKVQVTGVFTIERGSRSARRGRNPQTGEAIDIPASYSAKLTAGRRLKEAATSAGVPTA